MGKSRGVHETTPEIRNRMVGMYEAGLGLREIAAALNCSQRTVKRWLNRFDKEGSVETRDRCGRKRATTQEQDEAIIQLATKTPIKAAKTVLPALGLNCSVDTIRERLHRAGIHNWNPPKKHIQKIPIASTDEAKIQQPVWRPTGTQSGKKKEMKEVKKKRTKTVSSKKRSERNESKIDDDKVHADSTVQSEEQPNFSFSFPQQTDHTQQQMTSEVQSLPPPIPPLTLSPIQQPSHPVISNTNTSQYSHPLNLMPPQSQSIYHHHHPGLNIPQNWSLDLFQSAHHFMQGQHHTFHHEQHSALTLQSHLAIHSSHHESQMTSHVNGSFEPMNRSQNQSTSQEKLDKDAEAQQHEDLSELSQEKLNESQDIIINVCSDACSNSNCSSTNNSSVDDENSDSNFNFDVAKRKKKVSKKKKKGGKVKGTLETSVEIRNRMIGMSEAGLSTLSIALAINRSERTVKRWLDRWRKEGNVQTKERKGRRRITTKEEDDAIVAMATQQPLTAAKDVVPALGLRCSVDTIRERLHKAGIHSWKLGKKQGEGNSVPLQVWQPSGNRCSKAKSNKESTEKNRKAPIKKRILSLNNFTKKGNKKNSKDVNTPKMNTSSENVVSNQGNMHYQDDQQLSSVMQPAQSLLNTPVVLSQIQQQNQIPPIYSQCSVPSQTLLNMGPIPSQANSSTTYSSCMMGGNNHTAHIEQGDSVNYEPYIWSF